VLPMPDENNPANMAKRVSVFRGAESGEVELPPPIPHPHRHLLNIQDRREFPPLWSCCRMGSTLVSSPLPPFPQPFILGTVGFPPRHILRLGDPRMALCVYPRSYARTRMC
jgi:hypothetical protein